jgi:hypothetical protein
MSKREPQNYPVAINRFVAQNNADPKPFIWTADPRRVLAVSNAGNKR